MQIEDLINWKNVSKTLSGNSTSVRRKQIPKKYEVRINYLMQLLDIWNKDIDVWTQKEVQEWLKKIEFP